MPTPSLPPGTRLGPYEIVGVLGAGGMGEVYRARDAKLGRTVAIKVLLSAVARDPDRLARFEREARTLAALNHPNIAHIYGLEGRERQEGQEGETPAFLVMELVEGETLAERIARGPIPLDETLKIATQIADALEAAHAQSVIHRDLKPANIKVRPDGFVKVLDFGLAKIVEPIDSSRDPSNSPTITSPAMMTAAGVVLGTAAYMSPEQARGKEVDRRTDIWAFACVLYEMLTARQVFGGQTVTDVLAAIIEREPDWRLLPSSTPDPVRRLLTRCLAKDPRRRFHDIVDVRLELDDALSGSNPEPATALANSSRRRLPWAIAIGAVAFAVGAIGWLIADRTRQTATARVPDARLERLTYDSGVTRMPAVSPDGRLLAYASNRAGNGDLDVWVQQMSGGTPLRLTDDPADDSTPDFSPDGSQVVFRSERGGGGVYIVPALGGPARLIVRDGRAPRFSPDGSRIAYWTGQFRGQEVSNRVSSLYVVTLSGGTPARILADFAVAFDPVWAADGRSLLVGARREQQSSESFDWWVAPLDGKPPVKTGVFETSLLRGAGFPPSRWTPDGVLFSFNDDLWKVSLSSAGLMTAPPRRLTLGVGPYVDPAAGPNGEVVFARLIIERAVERASLTEVSAPAARLHTDSESTTWRASGTADGSTFVFERQVGASREIWIKNTASGRQELVVSVPTPGSVSATVSSDGARIAYTQESAGPGSTGGKGYVIETSGGVPRKICDACNPYGFLADNLHVLVALDDGHAIQAIDVRSNVARDLVVSKNGARLNRPHASPDDRWLAFRQQRGGEGKSFVVRLMTDRAVVADGLQPIDEPTTTGRPCGWSLDSQVLYLLLDTDGFRCVWGQRVDPQTGTTVGKPFAVRHFHSAVGMSTSLGNAVSAGGFIYETADASANLWKLTSSSSR